MVRPLSAAMVQRYTAAVIDLNTQPSALQSGKVVTAGFFDERWRLIEK